MRHDHKRYVKAALGPLLAFSCAVLLCLGLTRAVSLAQWSRLLDIEAGIGAFKTALSGDSGPESLKARLFVARDSLSSACEWLSREYGEVKDLSGILRLLIAKAHAADIQFVKMHPQNENASEAAARYPIILETTAPYNSLGRFISSIESLPHLVRVERIALTAVRSGAVEARLLVTCFLHSSE